MNRIVKAILLYLVDPRSIILAFAVFNFILAWRMDAQITFACVACPWYHPWSYFNEPTILLVASLFLRSNRWWGATVALFLSGYLVGYFVHILLIIDEPVTALRNDWKLTLKDYPYIVGSGDSQYLFALIILCCSTFYLTRAILRWNASRRAADNKSLDRSGDSALCNLNAPAQHL